MRKLFIILSFLIPVFCFSQNEQYIGTPTNIVKARGGLMSDSSYYLPLRDTNFIPVRNGAEILRAADGLVYKYVNGWFLVSSMVGDDYTVTTFNGTITANARINSGLSNISGTDAYTVIQAAISALQGLSQGSIGVTSGNYTLTNELTFTGIDGGFAPSHQIKMIGSGFSTAFIQTTSGKNAIVLKNAVGVVFKDFQVFVGSAAKSCILGDITGANTEISTWTSILDNLLLNSQSTTQPALYLRNIFDISVPTIRAFATANNAIVIENNSTTTDYGNSNFGFVRTGASTSGTFSGLKLTSVNTTKFVDHIEFNNYETVGGQHYGVFMDQALNITFTHVDIEASPVCISVGSVGGGQGSRGIKFLGGGVSPSTGGTAISAGSNSGGCDFNLYITADATAVPISDASQFLPPNYYNVILDAAVTTGNISITSPTQTVLIYRTTANQNTYLFFPTNTNGVTQSFGDNSTLIATDAFVNNRRTAYFEPYGNSTNTTNSGLFIGSSGTATSRTVANTNLFDRQRRIGYVSATTANAESGWSGFADMYQGSDGWLFQATFGINTYLSGERLGVGMNQTTNEAIEPSTTLNCALIYANSTDVNLSIVVGNGSTNQTVALGSNFPANTSSTDWYQVTFYCAPNSTSIQYTVVRLNTGNTATGTITNGPATTQLLLPRVSMSNVSTGAAVSMDIGRFQITTAY